MSAEPKTLLKLDARYGPGSLTSGVFIEEPGTDSGGGGNSWSSPTDGFALLVEASPNHKLALDDEGHFLIIQ
jgi:hypothetical protein